MRQAPSRLSHSRPHQPFYYGGCRTNLSHAPPPPLPPLPCPHVCCCCHSASKNHCLALPLGPRPLVHLQKRGGGCCSSLSLPGLLSVGGQGDRDAATRSREEGAPQNNDGQRSGSVVCVDSESQLDGGVTPCASVTGRNKNVTSAAAVTPRAKQRTQHTLSFLFGLPPHYPRASRPPPASLHLPGECACVRVRRRPSSGEGGREASRPLRPHAPSHACACGGTQSCASLPHFPLERFACAH